MKRAVVLFASAWLILLSVGCSSSDKQEKIDIYYLSMDGNMLVPKKAECSTVEEALDLLVNTADSSDVTSVFPKDVEVTEYLIDNNQLILYFNEAYKKTESNKEILLRAGVVQTMVQLDGIDFVSFYVEEEPLKQKDGELVGLMRAEDFIQNTGSSLNFSMTTDLILYFANEKGTSLKETKKTNIHYNANTAMEKLVIEQLMKGTSASGSSPTIPPNTKLLGVSVKKNICYVNFDSQFLVGGYNQAPEVTIYSIVNSVIANGNVTKVQILIDGSSDLTYNNKVDLRKPLEQNLNIVGE